MRITRKITLGKSFMTMQPAFAIENKTENEYPIFWSLTGEEGTFKNSGKVVKASDITIVDVKVRGMVVKVGETLDETIVFNMI